MLSTDIQCKLARNMVLDGIKISLGDEKIPAMPKKSFWLGNSDELTRDQIDAALWAFRMTLNLTSCNSGGRNLYELLDLYLRDPDARHELNNVLKAFGRDINGA